MRQLVSIVNDGFIRYYLAEGADLEEVARIRVGEKFSPEQAVILGLNVVEAVGKIAPSRPVVVAAVEAPAPQPTPARKSPHSGPRIVWKNVITYDKVLDVVQGHPGLTAREVCDRLGHDEDKARKSVANRLQVLRERGVVDSYKDGLLARWKLVPAQQPIPSVAQPVGSPMHAMANGAH